MNKVLGVFGRAYSRCLHSQKISVKEDIIQDLHQRMDELCLVYSQLFEVSVNDAKKELEFFAKGEESEK